MRANVYNGFNVNGYAVNGRNPFERDLALVEQAYQEQLVNGMSIAMNGIGAFIATVAKGTGKVIRTVGQKVVGAARRVVQKIKNFRQERQQLARQRAANRPMVGTGDLQVQRDYRQVTEVTDPSGEEARRARERRNWIIGGSIGAAALLTTAIVLGTRKRGRRR